MRIAVKGIVVPIILAALTLTGSLLSAADSRESLFLEGNKCYQSGQYEEALSAYQRILDAGFESGPLYYNMGNCCYKLSRIGPSILYYERAARSIPADEDLNANLAMANLFEANLSNADLRLVNFEKADLTGANLTNANIAGANLDGADLTDTIMPDGRKHIL